MRELRNSAGESLACLAGAVGTSINVLHRLETGKSWPRLYLLKAIAEHYGVDVSQILGTG